ncbi:hypothetical protein CAPTEDRAFT_177615 [Capitella teleta]|uniref:Uncharacterized protein n=1 Tax=Capitella teleta TaxID=283909 RepID=R7TX01_CAPTE|nr:hypothetical protein CAPTEDRAFT_177615 [Capitella teleta]|eukprot:ELT98438.1 hypothetical protein CAPTEDRAFT_177615 [Capitella teleta]
MAPVRSIVGPSPLVARLNSAHAKGRKNNKKKVLNPKQFTILVGDNFSVRYHETSRLQRLILDNASHGIVLTEFNPFRTLDQMSLSDSAQRLMDTPNAGGSSIVSEVLSYEVLLRCFGAQLLKTEMEVCYWPTGGSITDYTCRMFNTDLGISVTRAMKYHGLYTSFDAERLLMKKLKGVNQSNKTSLEHWAKQVLHIWATSKHVASVLIRTYNRIPKKLKANTVLLITVARNTQEVFSNS